MKLGMKAGLGPGHIVLDGDPAPKNEGTAASHFSPNVLWPNGWMDKDASSYQSREWVKWVTKIGWVTWVTTF